MTPPQPSPPPPKPTSSPSSTPPNASPPPPPPNQSSLPSPTPTTAKVPHEEEEQTLAPTETKFVLDSNSSGPVDTSYDLTVRSNNPNPSEAPEPHREDLAVKRFKQDMEILPDDRGLDEFADVSVKPKPSSSTGASPPSLQFPRLCHLPPLLLLPRRPPLPLPPPALQLLRLPRPPPRPFPPRQFPRPPRPPCRPRLLLPFLSPSH